jgi:hypothetical protein
MLAHVPEAVPTLPPPSNVMDDAGVPAVDIPVLTAVPVIELAPERLPAGELMPVQVVVLGAAGPTGKTPDVIGLTPGELNSVAPRGIPVPGTAGAGPMPSGEVMPSGAGVLPEICARAQPQLKKTEVAAIASKRVTLVSSPAYVPPNAWPLPSRTPMHASNARRSPAPEQGLGSSCDKLPDLPSAARNSPIALPLVAGRLSSSST